MNVLTNEIITPNMMMKGDAENLAAHLNQEFVQALDESIVNANSSGQGYDEDHVNHPLHATCVAHGFGYSHSTPVHMKSGDVKIHHTWANGEHRVGAVEGSNHWTSKTSPASGHSTSGVGAIELGKHLKGKAKRYPDLKSEVNIPIASTPITENILQPLDPRYAQYMNQSKTPNTMDGGRYQSTNPVITAMSDFRETARLRAAAAKKFVGNTGVTEGNAIRSHQAKNNPRPNQSLELLVNHETSDRDYLSDINKQQLLQG